jgi:hypothetical protein
MQRENNAAIQYSHIGLLDKHMYYSAHVGTILYMHTCTLGRTLR